MKKVKERLTCDMSGVNDDTVRTVSFSVFGREYSLELSAAEQLKLLDHLTPYIKAARRGAPGLYKPRRPRTQGDRDKAQLIRAWARDNGITLHDRGRIPGWVTDKYDTRDDIQAS